MNKLIKQAFTLIELLVVIAIIGILSGLIVVSMSGVTQKANIAKAQVFSNSLRNSLMLDLISEWKLDQIIGSSAPYTTPDSWSGGNTGTLADTSGACSFNGTLKCPQLVTFGCPSGNCLSFDGSNDYISITSSSLLNPEMGNMTWGSWIKTVSAGDIYIYSNYESSNDRVEFRSVSGKIRLLIRDEAFTTYRDSASLINDNNWHYVVAVWKGIGVSTIDIYIDGILNNSLTYLLQEVSNANIVPLGTYDCIGSRGNLSQFFNGSIDDVRIYNVAISTSQIKEQYYSGLNSMLANGLITSKEYSLRLAEIALR
ncbi:MAG: LamG-like jellyroll fold domain-containing protein [Candidatus Paceibacterota bacterium]|jgi:prepilin-type N-terminal cleavage/methylation domain-containing protein